MARSDVLAALFGVGHEDPAFIIRRLRLPRGRTAALVGAGFGVSGAIFQRIARNPLASPDIIGVNAGAAATAVFIIVIVGGSSMQITLGALGGSLVTSRSEEHTSELQSLMRISYAVFCLKKKKKIQNKHHSEQREI